MLGLDDEGDRLDEARPTPRSPTGLDAAVGRWLLLCAALVLAMVVLGGITRLTGSGLSIVEWRPVSGVVPPLGAAAWEEVFAAYRQTPEGRARSADFDSTAFQRIYWIEYVHRLAGRLLGMVVLLPLAFFAWRRRLSRRQAIRLLVLFLLGAAQGLVGWLMVASGLGDRPAVSPYRLAGHLLLAAGLFAGLLWEALEALEGARRPRSRHLARRLSLALGGVVALTLAAGAFMAGTGAGKVLQTFPLIDLHLIEQMWIFRPWWRNLLEVPAGVHLSHRSAALAALVLTALIRLRLRGDPGRRLRRWRLMAAALGLQIALGAATLLLGDPAPLAALHQLGGFLVLAAWVAFHHGLAVDRPVLERRVPDRPPAAVPGPAAAA